MWRRDRGAAKKESVRAQGKRGPDRQKEHHSCLFHVTPSDAHDSNSWKVKSPELFPFDLALQESTKVIDA